MLIKQLSIFVENKPGRLAAITSLLGENSIDIRAMSIADTTDFGILRLIVNHPDEAKVLLREAGFTVTITKVLAIGIEDKPGSLSTAMQALYENGITVEYMYAFISKDRSLAYVILRVNEVDRAVEVFKTRNVKVLTCEELYEM